MYVIPTLVVFIELEGSDSVSCGQKALSTTIRELGMLDAKIKKEPSEDHERCPRLTLALLDWFFARYRELVHKAVTGLRDSGYRGEVLYRTSVSGHTNCGLANAPVPTTGPRRRKSSGGVRGEAPPISRNNLAIFEDYNSSDYSRFRWGAILEYNQVCLRQGHFPLPTVAPRFPPVRRDIDGEVAKKYIWEQVEVLMNQSGLLHCTVWNIR